MPGTTPLTQDKRNTILALHAEGHSRNQIARETGTSATSVTRICKAAGATFDRTATAKATRAKVVDAKARRIAIIERLYTRSEAILTRLESDKYKTLVPIGPGEQATRELSYVPGNEERLLSAALTSYLGSAEKLEKIDADNGIAETETMLQKLIDRIGIPDE